MKRIIASCFLFLSLGTFAQDTTWVQTFTFDSISTRRALFDFPQELDTMRFEKVLMYYKLKCDAQTPWDQYACGEWDYLTYTRIFDHTGSYDSVQVDSVRYLHNFQSDPTYNYDLSVVPHKDTFDVQESYRSLTGLTAYPLSQTPGTPSEIPFAVSQRGGRFQLIVSASELTTAGITTGDLQALSLKITSVSGNGELQHPVIRMKATTLSTLTDWEEGGFTTVYDLSRHSASPEGVLVSGWNNFDFHTPFYWNGTDNIIIELFNQQGEAPLNISMFDMDDSMGSGLAFGERNGYLEFDGTNYAMLELSDLDLGNELTISFWAKGNGNTTVNTYMLEGTDTLGNRLINVHMPWSDNVMYWDCGTGSAYDRINKSMIGTDIDGQWHHWTFVKDQPNGAMYIYRDGALWHSGTNLNRAVGTLHRLILGANKSLGGNWKGQIDEFQIYNAALDATTIANWYRKKADNSHPFWSNLLVYYDFDQVDYAVDRSANDYLIMPSSYGMIGKNNLADAIEQYPLVEGVQVSRPLLTFYQGTTAASTSAFDWTYVKDKEPQSVFEFQPVDRHFEIVNAFLSTAEGASNHYDNMGTLINSDPYTTSEMISNEVITYFESPYEVVYDVEIGRYITPYGIQFDLGPGGFTWVYDVTDYQMYLHGAVDLAAHNTQELIDLKFAFIEGIPPRDVHSRRPIWKDWSSYSYASMDNDAVLSAMNLPLSDTSSMFKIKTRLTGHGEQGSTSCCEWDSKDHFISIDGVERFSWEIWEETACGDNPNVSQGGTWPYAREGWCPGDLVREYDHELTPFVNPGDTILIDYDITDIPAWDQNQGNGNFIVAMDLISYGPPNHQYDAAVIDILNPNDWEYYRKWNPSCQNPRVVIQNTGEQPLTACIINVWVDWNHKVAYNWTGNLNFLEKELVEIPIDDYSFWYDYAASGTFTAYINNINNQWNLDEYEPNNGKTVTYEAPESINGPFLVYFQTNNKASENQWRLVDSHENIIFERTSLSNLTQYRDTFDLAPGCYSIILEDSDNDGISFWYSNQVEGETSGNFSIKLVGGTYVEVFERDFGNYNRYNFTVGFDLGVDEIGDIEEEIIIYPNPNNGFFTVEMTGNIDHQAQLFIYDLTGRLVYTEKMNAKLDYAESHVYLNDLPGGYYNVMITTNNGVYSKPLLKQ